MQDEQTAGHVLKLFPCLAEQQGRFACTMTACTCHLRRLRAGRTGRPGRRCAARPAGRARAQRPRRQGQCRALAAAARPARPPRAPGRNCHPGTACARRRAVTWTVLDSAATTLLGRRCARARQHRDSKLPRCTMSMAYKAACAGPHTHPASKQAVNQAGSCAHHRGRAQRPGQPECTGVASALGQALRCNSCAPVRDIHKACGVRSSVTLQGVGVRQHMEQSGPRSEGGQARGRLLAVWLGTAQTDGLGEHHDWWCLRRAATACCS